MPDRTSQSKMRKLLVILCTLAAAATAQAASGINITPEQLSQVRQGMSRDDVMQALGRPANEREYGNRAGVTWVYRLLSSGHSNVHIDFGVDGKVTTTSKRMDYSGNG